MEKRIEHVGIVVENVNSAVRVLRKLLDLPAIPIRDYKKSGLHYRIAFVSFGGVVLELIEPVNKKGMAQEHLDQFGPGVYHFALQVPDLDEVARECRVRGFKIQDIRTGAAGGRVTFLKDPVLSGIYLEFVEPVKH